MIIENRRILGLVLLKGSKRNDTEIQQHTEFKKEKKKKRETG